MNALTNDSKRLTHTHQTNKREKPRAIVFTGRDNDPPDRDPSLLLPNVYDPDFYCRVCDTAEANLSDYIKHLVVIHQIVEDHVRKKKNRKATYKDEIVSSANALKAEKSEEDNGDVEKEKTITLYGGNEDASENEEIIMSNDGNDHDTCKDNEANLCVTTRQYHCGKRISAQKSTPAESNGNAKLDINDPNYYSHSCRKRYFTRGAFRFHFRTVHQIQNIPVNQEIFIVVVVQLNLILYPTWTTKTIHLIDQLVNTTAIKNQQPLSITTNRKKPTVYSKIEHIPNQYYCNNCTTNLENPIRYHIHVQNYHPTTTNPSTTSNKDTDTKPDVKNPSFYCQSCRVTKPNRRSYLTHLYIIYKISLSSTINK